MTTTTSLNVGDIVSVEILGQEIGSANVSEITDDFVEVVYMGHAIKLGPDVLDYYDIGRQISSWGI